MKLESLRDLLIEQVGDLYDAETRITRALPKMAEAATSPDLKQAFQKHLAETEGQIGRLDRVFECLGLGTVRKTCKAMEGLIAEGEETIKEEADPEVKDAALVAAAQRIEPADIVEALFKRGLKKILVEGGGTTISHFINAGIVDRIHILAAPLILGSGIPGLSLMPVDSVNEAIRPETTVHVLDGGDVLFDCDLRHQRRG